MLGLFAYVAALIAAAAGLVIIYVVCVGHDRAVVRSRNVARRSMLAFFACAASLTAVAAGVVILLNMAVDTAEKNRLVRTAHASTVGTAPASIAKSVVPPIAMPAASSVVVMVDQPGQAPKRKKAAVKQKPRFAERRPGYSSPWGGQGLYNNW